jgi:asparagine synthase (glutamine-hydrolysing)
MCGITGVVHWDGRPASEAMLRDMARAIEHRGRDAEGVLARDTVGLAHRRLSIVDVSHGADQPMHSADGSSTLIFNGEIVNFIELRRDLQELGHSFRTNSDTEVLLVAWRQWGLAALARLRGFFAFVIADWRAGQVVLVRDPMGIKPLYIAQSNGALIFGSEIKALLASKLIDARIDPLGLADYLAMQVYAPGRTLFQDVEAVLPGHAVVVDLASRSVRRHCYWALPPVEERPIAYEAACEEFDAAAAEVVRMWCRADVPIGAYVSGGIDSSFVAALASGATVGSSVQANLPTFSSVFPGASFPDEGPFSDAVARHLESDHHRVRLPLEQVIADHDRLIYGLDMPIAGYSAPYRTMAREVRKYVKVVLCGHGGDETLCGYPRYLAMALTECLCAARDGAPYDADLLRALPYLEGFEEQTRRMLGDAAFRDRRALYQQALDRSSFLIADLHPSLHEAIGEYDPISEAVGLFDHSICTGLKGLMRLDQLLLLPALLHVEDRTSMMENLESRPPLLDHTLVTLATRIPSAHLLRNGLKSVLRDAAAARLPSLVTRNKRKSGVMFPIMDFTEHPELRRRREMAFDRLDNSGLFMRPAREMLRTKPDLVSQRTAWALWSLGDWCASFGLA